MCGDLSSCFDFSLDGDRRFPTLPDASGSEAALAAHLNRPKIMPPREAQSLFQERGVRPSRALPYVLHVHGAGADNGITLAFANEGSAGATFHVYDKRHLDRLPRRYAVEAGKSLNDHWDIDPDGIFDILVLGPNGLMRSFTGNGTASLPQVEVSYDQKRMALALHIARSDHNEADLRIGDDLYGLNAAQLITSAENAPRILHWSVKKSHGWYDFALTSKDHVVRLAGRLETGKHGFSDPLLQA